MVPFGDQFNNFWREIMADVIRQAHGTISIIKNGAIVTFAQMTGEYERSDPDLNTFIPSGVIEVRYDNRFDDVRYYTGDTPN